MSRPATALAIGLLLVTGAGSAAEAGAQWGGLAGVTASTMGGPAGGDNPGFRWAPAAGLYGAVWIGRGISLEAGATFAGKGVARKGEGFDPGGGVTSSGFNGYALDYLEFPVLLRWSSDADGIRPTMGLGPALGVVLAGKHEQGGGSTDVQESLTNPSVGMQLAIGLVFPAGKLLGRLEGRYTLGLSEVFRGEQRASRHHTVALAIGIGSRGAP